MRLSHALMVEGAHGLPPRIAPCYSRDMRIIDEPLITLAALAAGSTVPSRAPSGLWPVMIQRAIDHGLAPLLLYRIHEAGFEPQGVDLASIKRAANQSAARYTLLETAHARLNNALREAGIVAVWLKGIALAQTIYPEPSLRPMNDLDALIPLSQRAAALAASHKAGYNAPQSPRFLFSPDDPLVQRWSHHDYLVGGPAKAVTFELHSRLISADDAALSADDIDWFLANNLMVETPLAQFMTLAPLAHLVYLCAHAEIQHRDFYLLRYLDLHLLIAQSPLDWQAVVERAVELRWTLPVENALRTCVTLFGSHVPVDALEQLKARRPADEDTLRARLSKGRGARWLRVKEMLGRLSPSGQRWLIASVLFPPPAYMRERYNLSAGQAVWPSYIYRWLDQAREVWRAVIKERKLRQQDRAQKRP